MDDIIVKSIEDMEAYGGPHAIPGIRFRFARAALGVSAWGMSVIELEPGCSSYPAHEHTEDGHEEVYFVVRGAAFLQTPAGEHALPAGTFARVPPRVARKLVTRDVGATVLALGGTPGQSYAPSTGRAASVER